MKRNGPHLDVGDLRGPHHDLLDRFHATEDLRVAPRPFDNVVMPERIQLPHLRAVKRSTLPTQCIATRGSQSLARPGLPTNSFSAAIRRVAVNTPTCAGSHGSAR